MSNLLRISRPSLILPIMHVITSHIMSYCTPLFPLIVRLCSMMHCNQQPPHQKLEPQTLFVRCGEETREEGAPEK